MHILSPVTDNCPSWISRRKRMAVEIITWPNSIKECCWTQGTNPRPSPYLVDVDPTKPPRPSSPLSNILWKYWFTSAYCYQKRTRNLSIMFFLGMTYLTDNAFCFHFHFQNLPLQGSFFTKNSSSAIQPPPTRTITVLRRILTSRSFCESPNWQKE